MMLNCVVDSSTSRGALQPVEDRSFPRAGLRSPDDDDHDDGDDGDNDDDDNVDDDIAHREKATFVKQSKGVNFSQSHLEKKNCLAVTIWK